jgi:hypothetical protein
MSSSDAARRIRERFKLGTPPSPADTKGNLQLPTPGKRGRPAKAEKMAQLNLRVPQDVKDRVRLLAARDRREMSQIVMEGIALYEERHGAVPILQPTRSD